MHFVEGRDDAASVVVENQPTPITDSSPRTPDTYLAPSGDDDTLTISSAGTCSCGERWEGEQDTLVRERDAAVERVAELEDQLDAVISATQALARLVKKKPPMKKLDADDDAPSNQQASPVKAEDEDLILDGLIKRWRLEDTGFVSLYSSCKAMQSSLQLTQADADFAVEEMMDAKTAASEAKSGQKQQTRR